MSLAVWYTIPAEPDAQAYLRRLCYQVLEFEHYFLRSYRDYLLEELQQTNAVFVRFAVQRLEQLIYPDEEVTTA